MTDPTHRVADIAAAVSIPAWLLTFVTDWGPVVTFTVGILTGVVLIFSALVKYQQWRKLKGEK
jgi:hypothetical protein